MSVAVFAYGSLVSAESAAETLGRPAQRPLPVVLKGWRRTFSLVRDNLRCEKTFARAGDGSIPDLILALNIEVDPGGELNGALLSTSPEELERLDRRELRYDRIEVGDSISLTAADPPPFKRIFTYVAKPPNHTSEAPPGAVVLASYERAVEAAFASLGPGQLEAYRSSTAGGPAERIEAELVAGSIPAGNPRAW